MDINGIYVLQKTYENIQIRLRRLIMDKCTIENFKMLALPGATLGVLLWIIKMALDPFVLFLTLGMALVFITIDKLNEER